MFFVDWQLNQSLGCHESQSAESSNHRWLLLARSFSARILQWSREDRRRKCSDRAETIRNSFSIFRMIVAIVWVSRQLTYKSAVDCSRGSRGSRGSRLLESPNGVFLLIFIGCSTAFAATFETSWWKLPPVSGPCRFQVCGKPLVVPQCPWQRQKLWKLLPRPVRKTFICRYMQTSEFSHIHQPASDFRAFQLLQFGLGVSWWSPQLDTNIWMQE